MVTFNLSDSVKIVLSNLEAKGFEAFVVGGYVRDLFLGKETHDCDVTTNAKPNEIEQVFEDYKQSHIGKDHGTIGVRVNGEWIEITTYRVDEAILDHRRPKTVRFSQHLKEDVLRRDFTMNALALDKKGSVIDFVGGQKDIEAKLIRCVGDPHLRFDEDALRILRALRFSAQLAFKIEENSIQAMRAHAPLLRNLAVERIFQEFQLIFLAPTSSRAFFNGQGILNHVVPELEHMSVFDINMLDEFEHALIKWVICFRECSEKQMQDRLNALKAPKQFIQDGLSLHRCYHHEFINDDYALKSMMKHYPSSILAMAMDMQMKMQDSIYNVQAHDRMSDLIEYKVCVSIKDLAIDGYDLMRFGIHGKHIQMNLEKALEGVMRDQVVNSKAELLAWLNLTS